jgi:hypothetical protein
VATSASAGTPATSVIALTSLGLGLVILPLPYLSLFACRAGARLCPEPDIAI